MKRHNLSTIMKAAHTMRKFRPEKCPTFSVALKSAWKVAKFNKEIATVKLKPSPITKLRSRKRRNTQSVSFVLQRKEPKNSHKRRKPQNANVKNVLQRLILNVKHTDTVRVIIIHLLAVGAIIVVIDHLKMKIIINLTFKSDVLYSNIQSGRISTNYQGHFGDVQTLIDKNEEAENVLMQLPNSDLSLLF